ncbi:hypothetical protein L226DRAFT_540132 [Lentinus tigrinus ALCF2SS1-7]|uniref:Uncharacterized protein n=1 Tax=Lentinus tigrinus ALCF2SS1-6 TaxID=1328759 RepID=A0A5C2RXD6_9APHY|nr:hypothetical protein L227DRAFT_579467 [Lentinus tigrinus ALCF2SS1-6]RPD69126.1 hypothetical protein L226DRAFT_540132 [Lentinus tigrinus ALCF2SS1-7]
MSSIFCLSPVPTSPRQLPVDFGPAQSPLPDVHYPTTLGLYSWSMHTCLHACSTTYHTV